MDNIAPYPKYTEAPDSWVGSYPSHWSFKRAHFCSVSRRATVSVDAMEELSILHYSIPNVQEYGTGRIEDGADIDSAKQLVDAPTLLVSKLNPYKVTVCVAHPSDELLTVASGEFVPIQSKEFDLGYAYYVWASEKLASRLTGLTQSVTRSHQRVSPEDITKIPWAWPPLAEQGAIVTFLDRETARIDALIDKKRRLLDLLEEKRLAVITHAVTKGLDPQAPMKESGIAWLGQIPAHWEVKRVKFSKSLITSGSRGWAEYYADEGPIFLQSGNLGTQAELNLTNLQHVSPPDGAEGRRTAVCLDDVMVCITGARTGTVAHVSVELGEAYINQHIALCRPIKSDVFPKFLAYALWCDAGRQQLSLSSYGMKEGLGLQHVLAVLTTSPPISEQEAIVSHIDREQERLNSMALNTQRAISLLLEYRSALITNAVTGKIDVRGEVSKEAAA